MHADQSGLNMFEVAVSKLYDARKEQEHGEWIESLVSDVPTLEDVRINWQVRRRLLIYSPVIDNSAIGPIAMDQLTALAAIKHSELNVPFDYTGKTLVAIALATDIFKRYGFTDRAYTMTSILNAILVGPAAYHQQMKHYPIDEKAFVLAYIEDHIAATARHY